MNIDEIINANMKITDSRLRDAIHAVCVDVIYAVHEKYDESMSADVKAMNEAQVVLQAIKDTDPGVYDEMIDNVLRLIADALNLVVDTDTGDV